MISFNLKSSLAIAIICFVLGCCTEFLLTGRCNNNTKRENIMHAEVLKQQADSIGASYQAKITELETRNLQLQQQLTTTKTQLSGVKARTKSKSATIKKIIEPKGYPAKELLKKVDPSVMVMDSSLPPCDSLVQEISEYMELNETKDSLYEVQITTQDSLITGKNSIIAFKTGENKDLLGLFNQSLKEQHKMLSENNQLRRRVKRQKLKGKLFTIGTAILSGLTTHYLTR